MRFLITTPTSEKCYHGARGYPDTLPVAQQQQKIYNELGARKKKDSYSMTNAAATE